MTPSASNLTTLNAWRRTGGKDQRQIESVDCSPRASRRVIRGSRLHSRKTSRVIRSISLGEQKQRDAQYFFHSWIVERILIFSPFCLPSLSKRRVPFIFSCFHLISETNFKTECDLRFRYEKISSIFQKRDLMHVFCLHLLFRISNSLGSISYLYSCLVACTSVSRIFLRAQVIGNSISCIIVCLVAE